MSEPDDKSKEALAKAILAAKTKRSFFALIVKGASDGKLIVSKIKIPTNEIAAAKKAVGGTAVLQGVCFGEQGKLVFKVAELPAETTAKLVKTIAHRDAGLQITAEFREGKPADLEAEGQEDQAEQQEQTNQPEQQPEQQNQSDTTAGDETPPPQAPPLHQADPQIAQLSAAMTKLGPSVQAAIKAHPNRKDELLGVVAEFQKHIHTPNAELAKESLLTLGNKVKEAMQSNAPDAPVKSEAPVPNAPKAPPAPPPPPAPPNPAMMQLTSAMAKLAPIVQATLKSHPDRKDDLTGAVAKFRTAVTEGNANDAKAALLGLNNLIKEIAATPSETAETEGPETETPETEAPETPTETSTDKPNPLAATWKQALGDLEPRYLEALKKARSDLAGKMRASFAYATEQAEAGQFETALAVFKRLEPMIGQALEGNAPGEIEKGIVEKRKFLVTRFRDLMGQVTADAAALRKAIEEKVPDENADELAGLIEEALSEFVSAIRDEIDDAINAGSSSVLRGLRKRVSGSALMQKLANNDLGVNVELQDKMNAALDEIEEKMAA